MKQINDKQTQGIYINLIFKTTLFLVNPDIDILGKRVNKVRINKEAVKRIINSSR